jgi:hypothetical protein
MFGIAHTIRLFSLPMVLSFAVFSVLALTGRFQSMLRSTP